MNPNDISKYLLYTMSAFIVFSISVSYYNIIILNNFDIIFNEDGIPELEE